MLNIQNAPTLWKSLCMFLDPHFHTKWSLIAKISWNCWNLNRLILHHMRRMVVKTSICITTYEQNFPLKSHCNQWDFSIDSRTYSHELKPIAKPILAHICLVHFMKFWYNWNNESTRSNHYGNTKTMIFLHRKCIGWMLHTT